MEVQSVRNQIFNVEFGAKKQIERASVFVNADDNQLRILAYEQTFDKKDRKHNPLRTAIYAIPFVDSIAHGVLLKEVVSKAKNGQNKIIKATLGAKTEVALKTVGRWAGILAVIGVFRIVKNAIDSNSPKLKEFEQNSPFLSLLTDIGMILAGFVLAKKGKTKLEAKYPKLKELVTNNINKAKKAIDKSKFNKKVMPMILSKLAIFNEKAPWAINAGKVALEYSMFIILGISIGLGIKSAKDDNKKFEHNYQKLKEKQFNTAKYLVNTLNVERDVLAQAQPKLAKNLRHNLNKYTRPTGQE